MKRLLCLATAVIMVIVSMPTHSTYANPLDFQGELTQDPATLFYHNQTASQSYTISREQPHQMLQQEESPQSLDLWLGLNPAIFIPGAPTELLWEIGNPELLPDSSNSYLVFYLPESLAIDGLLGVPQADGSVQFTLPVLTTNGALRIVQVADFSDVILRFSVELQSEDVLIPKTVTMPVMPDSTTQTISQPNSTVASHETGLTGEIIGSMYVTMEEPSPHRSPTTTLLDTPVEVLAVDIQTAQNITHFDPPLQVSISYDESLIKNGQEESLQVYAYDASIQKWYPLDTQVDALNNELTADIGVPGPISYKNSDWQTYIQPMLENYEVSGFTGAATFNYGINVFPGTNGIAPNLGLSYSSLIVDTALKETQASWVGLGWNLETGSITRDMHGTPDEDDDTFFISLGGLGGRMVPISTEGYTTWYSVVDTSFDIIKFDDNTQIWTILTKDGNTHQFGLKESDIAWMEPGIVCSQAQAQDKLIWKWQLSTTIDRFGNTITYTNVNEAKPGCSNKIAVYPVKVDYDHFSVVFGTKEREDWDPTWDDFGAMVLFSKQRLDTISIYNFKVSDDPVRTYSLSYADSPVGPGGHNSLLSSIDMVGAVTENTPPGDQPAVEFSYVPADENDDSEGDLRLASVSNGYGGQILFDYVNKDAGLSEGQQYPPTAQWKFAGEGCSGPVSGWLYDVLISLDRRVYCNTALTNKIFHDIPAEIVQGQGMVDALIKIDTSEMTANTFRFGFKKPGDTSLIQPYLQTVVIDADEMEVYLDLEMPSDLLKNKYVIYFEGLNARLQEIQFILPIAHKAVSSRVEFDDITDQRLIWNYEYDEKFGVNLPSQITTLGDCPGPDCTYTQPGAGFRGYSFVKMIREPLPGEKPLVIVTEYHQDDDLKGRISRQTTQLGLGTEADPAKPLSVTEYSYTVEKPIPYTQLPAPFNQYTDLDVRWVYQNSKITTLFEDIDANSRAQLVSRQTYSYFSNTSNVRAMYAAPSETITGYGTGLVSEPLVLPTITDELKQTTTYEAPVLGAFWYAPLPTSQLTECLPGAECQQGSELRETLIEYNPKKQPIAQRALVSSGQYAYAATTYDPDTGQVSSQTSYQGFAGPTGLPTGVGTTTSYLYDEFFTSQVSQQTVAANGIIYITKVGYNKINGQAIHFTKPDGSEEGATYDSVGRLVRICAPYDWGDAQDCADAANPTAKVSYQISEAEHYSVTVEKIGLPTTIAYYDSFGKQLEQRQIGAEIDGDLSWVRQVALNYDAYGRQILASQPEAFPLQPDHDDPPWAYEDLSDNAQVTTTRYDSQDRVIEVGRGQYNPDDIDYYIESSSGYYAQQVGSEFFLVTEIKDAEKHTSTAYKDQKGQLVRASPPKSETDLVLGPDVINTYDAFGQLTQTQYGPDTDEESYVSKIWYNYAGQKIEMDDADMGEWHYSYNALGSLLTQTNAEEQTVCMAYDQLNRLTSKSHGANGTCSQLVSTYLYDQNGQLGYRTGMIDNTDHLTYPQIQTSWSYDLRGRLTSETRTLAIGEVYATSWQYNSADQMTRMTYPSGMVLDYEYLPQGGTKSVTGFLDNVLVDELSRVTSRQLSNTTTTNYTYQPFLTGANRLEGIETTSPNKEWQNFTYSYDDVGNILSITDLIGGTDVQTFTYDEMNRLLTASGSRTTDAYNLTMAYDPSTGNILSKDGNPYTYYPNDKPHAVRQAGSRTFEYDANGNMTHEGVDLRFTYNAEGKVVRREGCTYIYDGDGKRVIEFNQGLVPTIWIGNYYEKDNTQSTNTFNEYIYADGVRIGMRKNNQINYWFHLDHLGGTNVVTMTAAQFNSRDYYKPWGEQRGNPGNTDTRYFFTGQMKEDVNLYYYGARWYDPSLGRFLQADTLTPTHQGTQAWDRFAYVNNNPIAFIDSDGNLAWLPVITLVGGLVGAAIDYGKQVKQNYESNGGNLAAAFTEDIDVGSIANSAIGGAVTAFSLAAAAPAVLSMAGAGLMGVGVLTGSTTLVSAGLTASTAAVSVYAALYGLNQMPAASAPEVTHSSQITLNQQKGLEGQAASGWPQNSTRIYHSDFNANYRIPDYLNPQEKILGEVKNVSYQSLTSQLKDFVRWSQDYGYSFQLQMPSNTVVSKSLQSLIDSGAIQRIDLVIPY